jgi:tRNA A-37 threonylcarbamoyl transferase component Bud32
MPNVSSHPSAQALTLFGHGRLPEEQVASITDHLQRCAACRQAVARLAPDTFLNKLRGPDEAAEQPAAPEAVTVPPLAVPPALANHPKFRIVRELGRGGMGVIYLAEHRVMEKRVALKVINPSVLDNAGALARFQGEAKAAGRLDHPNIARAYDADQAGDLHFLVMEFVEGLSLAQVLQKKGPLPIANACHYVRQAALGLQHASEQGMVHRDVKPQNLMLTTKGQVKVLDFGLARLRSEGKRGEGLTQADAFMGTPEYVAPEQATDARTADIRADIYSLGCTLYALLTGRPPFVEDTVVKLVMAQIEKEPPPLQDVRPDVPAELAAVVAKMLAKDPAERYQRPVEVAQALAPFIKTGGKGGAVAARPTAPPLAAAESATVIGGETSRAAESPSKQRRKAEKPLWKRPAVLAGAAGGVVVIVVLAAVALWLGHSGPAAPAPDDGHGTPPPPSDGFVALFNGKDLTGWKPHPNGKAQWDVKDGILTGSGDVGHLFYEASNYENFHLRVEAMINDGGNSGVFFRTPFGPANQQGYPIGGYEAQIDSTHRDPRRTGSLFMPGGVAVERKETPVKPGEWFKMEVHADGPHIVLTVNGETTADYVDAAPHSRVGHIALQVLDSATVVKFRKVEIKELPSGNLRLQWAHSRGHFDQVKGNVWMEYFDDKRAFWRAIAWDENLVRLQAPDLSERWIDIHLRDPFYYTKVGGNGPWNKAANGAWKVRERLPPVEKSPAARLNEWVPLFNGRDLDGWEAAGNTAATWSWEGGSLAGRASGSQAGLLVSRRADYDHFHLHLETMLPDRHPGFVLFRCGPPGDGAGGYQGYGVRIGAAQEVPQKTGGLGLGAVGAAAPLSAAPNISRKPGEWFPMDILAEGNRLRVLLDGQTAVDYVDRNDTFTAGRLLLYCTPGAVLHFRNVTIKELAPPARPVPAAGATADSRGFVSLFNGRDLTGWKAFPQTPNHWEVKNGILTCRSGPTSNLCTERDDYQDFHLRVEARINSAGNSGLMFWSEPGAKDFPSYESDIHCTQNPDQTGSLWEWTPTLRHVARAGDKLMAPDQWFTHEVIAEGNRVKVLINGKPAVDTTLWVKDRARGRLGLQHLDPKTVVEFRKVEVNELHGN